MKFRREVWVRDMDFFLGNDRSYGKRWYDLGEEIEGEKGFRFNFWVVLVFKGVESYL